MLRRALALFLLSAVVPAALPVGAGLSTAAAAPPPVVQVQGEPAGQRTTPFTQTVRNDDGTSTLTSYVSPRFAREAGGAWRKADAEVSETGDDAAPLAAARAYRPVKFGSDPAQLVRLELEQGPVVLSAKGFAKVKPGKVGKKIKYKAVARDTDLDFGVGPAGLRDELTLLSDRAARSFTYHLSDPTGQLGSPQPQADGGFRFDRPDKDGVYLKLGRAWAYEKPVGDAEPDYDLSSAKLTVVRTGDGFDITKSVNEAWLAGKTFPVVLDPVMYFVGSSQSSDCWLQNASHASTPMCFNSLVAGTNAGELARSIVRFPMPGVTGTGATIRGAQLTLQQTGNACACSQTVVVSSVAPGNRAWQWNNNASWARYDQYDANGAWSGIGLPDGAGPVAGRDIQTFNIAAPTSTTPSSIQRDINNPALLSTVQGWSNNGATEHGFHIRGSEATTGTKYIKFDASEQSFGPQLRVDYVAKPDKPSVTSVSEGDGQLSLSFNGSGNAGAAEVSGYTAIARRSDGAEFTGSCANGACTIGGLANGTAYTVRVRANGSASSTDSDARGPFTPFGAPSAVGDLSADADPAPAAVRLSFSPAGTNGRPISGYTVRAFDRSNGGRTEVAAASAPVGCAPKVCYDVTGLRNATAYSFTVTANAGGRSSAESNEAFATPYGVPDAPTGLASSRQPGAVTVTWAAARDNGRPLTGHTVRLFNEAGAEVNSDSALDGNARSKTFSTTASGAALTFGSKYSFTVSARNQRGAGPSASAGPQTAARAPDAPTSVTATNESAKVSATWATASYGTDGNGPASGGDKVTGYVVGLWRTSDNAKLAERRPGFADPQPVVFAAADGVEAGGKYHVTVAATNGFGTGPTARSSDVTAMKPIGLDKTVQQPVGGAGDGDVVSYGLTLKNDNSIPVRVSVKDTPAAGLRLARNGLGKLSSGDCARSGITCSITSSGGLDVLTVDADLQPRTSTTITYPAQVSSGAGRSTCSLLGNTAEITDPVGTRKIPAVTSLACNAGLGLESWWTFRSTPIGPQANLAVNVANGNAVVQAVDTTPVQAHGRLSYVLRRTYNSAARTIATLPGSIGAGWSFNFGESDTAGLSAGTSLHLPSVGDAAATAVNPLGVTLVDRDGTRHQFTPRAATVALNATGLTDARSALNARTLTAAPGARLCLDVAYDAPPGVHLGLWRYVSVGTSGDCGSVSSSTERVVVGYAAVRPDRLRTEYDALGRLVSLIDAAGVELRYLYASPVDKPLDPARDRLTAVFEPHSCKTADGTDVNAAEQLDGTPCRAFRFDYSQAAPPAGSDQVPAVTVTDPARRTTRYELSKSLTSGGIDPVARLLRVVDPDGGTTSYTYGCGGGSADQLCGITDRRGASTDLSYATAASDPAGSPARVASVTDRRGTRTTYSYDSGSQTTARTSRVRARSTTDGVQPNAADTASPDQRAVYSSIDGDARVGVLEQFAGDSSTRLHRTVYGWDKPGSICEQPATQGDGTTPRRPDNNLCAVERVNAATGDGTAASNERTEWLFNREGMPLRERRALDRDSALITTTGYQTQYVGPSSNVPATDKIVGGGDVESTQARGEAGTLFAVSDRTETLTARGNELANKARFADYLTSYTVDNNPAMAVSAFRPDAAYCATPATDGQPNSTPARSGNTGLVCQTKAPATKGAGGSDVPTVTRATYDGFGQKTSSTSAKAVADTSPTAVPPATRFRYFDDAATDITGSVSAGGWLRQVLDVTATTSTPGQDGYQPTADHFVAYDYDRAGNTVRTWDRDATAGRSRDDFPGALSGARTGGAPAPRAALAAYGTTAAGEPDHARPWRYVLSSTDPVGNRTDSKVDRNGNVTTLTPPRGTAAGNSTFDVTSAYDDGDLLLRTATPLQRAVDPDNPGNGTRHSYDAFGNRTSTIWPDQPGEQRGRHAAVTRYDAVNRSTGVITSRGPATADGARGCRPATDADAPILTAAEPGAAEGTRRTVCQTTVQYDHVDNAVRSTDADGETSTTTYDALHRPTASARPRKVGQEPTLVTRTTYDADGRPLDVCRPRQQSEGGGGCDATSRYATHTAYDLAGRPISSTTRRSTPGGGAVQTLTSSTRYDADGNVVLVRDPRGGTGDAATEYDTTTEYDLQGRRTALTVPRNGTEKYRTRYLYSPSGDLLGQAEPGEATDNPAGSSDADKKLRITGYTYDADHRVVDTVTGLQLPTFTDDALSKVLPRAVSSAKDQTNLRTRVQYDPDGRVTTSLPPRAFTSTARPDGSGGTGSAALLDEPDRRFARTVAYDRDGRPTSQLTPRADGSGDFNDPTGRGGPDSDQVKQCAAGAAGYPGDVLVCRTTVEYDALGNVTTVRLPTSEGAGDASRTLSYRYTDDNIAVATIAPDPSVDADRNAPGIVVARRDLDGNGRTRKAANALGRTSTTTYTADGLVASSEGPAGAGGLTHRTVTTFNDDGQPVRVETPRTATAADGSRVAQTPATDTAYYEDGLVASVTNGRVTAGPASTTGDLTIKYGYDAAGNTNQVFSPEAVAKASSNPAGAPTTSTYTADDLLDKTVEPVVVTGDGVQQARTTEYAYDPAGRKKQVSVGTSGQASGTQGFAYYPSDLLAQQTGRKGEVIKHGYDADGQQVRVTDSNSDSSVDGSYYLDGLARQVSDRGRTTSYAYDGKGAPSVRAQGPSGQSGAPTTFTRNDAGLPTRMGEGLGGSGNGTTGWTYDQLGQPKTETRPNGQAQEFDYDSDQTLRSTTITRSGSSDPLAKWAYQYDELGRTLSQTYSGTASSTTNVGAGSGSGAPGTEPAPAQPVSYRSTYDNAGRLSAFTDARGTRTLTFDKNNNRTLYGKRSAAGQTDEPDPSSFTYRADDSIAGSDTPVKPGIAETTNVHRDYEYDAFGALLDDGCSTYGYDGFDRLTSTGRSDKPSATGCTGPDSTYRYDGLDRQISRTQAPTGTTRLDYDGWNSAVLHQAGGGATGVDLSFVLDAGGTARTAVPGSEAVEYLAQDGAGSTGLITGPDGASRCLARYDAYGLPDGNDALKAPLGSCASGQSANDVFYRGGRKDTGTGQYNLGSRTYDPAKAGFLTPDSYRTGGSSANAGLKTDPLTRNSYGYVNGDPINYTDPTGHEPRPHHYSNYKQDDDPNTNQSYDYERGNQGPSKRVARAEAPKREEPRRKKSGWRSVYDGVAGAGAGVLHAVSDTSGFIQRYSPQGQALDLIGLQDDLDELREGLEDSFVAFQRNKLGVDTSSLAYKIGDKGTQIGLAVAPVGGAAGAVSKAPRVLSAVGKGRKAVAGTLQASRRVLSRRPPTQGGMAGVREAGMQGERAAGIVKNSDRIPSISGTAEYRIPDELNATTLGEVKNVRNLSYTNQLRDFSAYAQQERLVFNLYVRESTTFSRPLQEAVDAGIINPVRRLPG